MQSKKENSREALDAHLNHVEKSLGAAREQVIEAEARLAEIRNRFRATSRPTKEILHKAGVDAAALEAATREERELIKAAHERFRATPPPMKRGRFPPPPPPPDPDPATALLYPAIRATPSSGTCPADAATATMRLSGSSTGLGGSWGVLAIATPQTSVANLEFAYIPETNGTLTLTPNVTATGLVFLFGNTHWYSRTEVHAKLKVEFTLWQTADLVEPRATAVESVVDVDTGDILRSDWLQTSFSPALTAFVVGGFWVSLHATASLFVEGVSDSAVASLDFCSGPAGIQVTSIDHQFIASP